MWKKILVLTAILGGVALLTGGWYLQRLRTGPGLPSGELVLPGLEGRVDVLWDSLGIPHVWAEGERDMLVAQGWVTARDRLWQMEMLRRVAAGRLSELFGESTVETDRFLRTVGMDRAAARTEAALDSGSLDAVEAYVEGVNAAIAGWKGPLPPEFVVLRHRPEPWTVTQALALEKIMAWDLAEYDLGLDLAQAWRAVGDEGLERVRPRYPEWGPTIVEGDPDPVVPEDVVPERVLPEDVVPEREVPDSVIAGSIVPDSTRPWGGQLPAALIAGARVPGPAAAALEAGSTVRASNSWVVGPERSLSGRPVLANDMHLALNAPNIWYLVGLHAPGVDVVGMSLPGSPWVVAGHTSGVAWGFTNAVVDDTDFFVERASPEDPARYLTPGGSEPFRTRTEEIRVRGRAEGDVERLVVRETRHGPVISSVDGRSGEEMLALRWVAHDPSTTVRALGDMNRASSVAELLAALEEFTNPHQNVVFADTAGRWGYWMAGRVPRRASGRAPVLPVPGWTGEHDWSGHVPFQDHPHTLEPAEGFVVTANNRQTRAPISHQITDGTWASPHRAMAIRSLILARERHDASSLHAIQLDVGSTFAHRHRPRAVAAFREAGEEAAADALDRWDGQAPVTSREATLFYAWIEALRSMLQADLYGDDGAGYFPMAAVERALDEGRVAPEVGAAAATAAAADAGGLPWGEAHLLTLGHPLAGVPVVGRILGFGRAGIPREGQPHSVNVASYRGRRPPFEVTHGPSQRHVVDMADLDGAGGFILPGGQSGWPASARGSDQLERWQAGSLVPLPMSRAAVEARTVSRVTLRGGGPPE